MSYSMSTLGYSGPPSQDPRLVRRFASVRATYTPRNIPPSLANRVPGMLAREARSYFPGTTIKDAGWKAGGVVGFTIIVPSEMRAGDIKQRFFNIGQAVGPRIGTNTALINPKTIISGSDLREPEAAAPAPSEGGEAPPASSEEPAVPFYMNRTVWFVAGGMLLLVGGGVWLVRKRRSPAAVTANRKKRRHSRRHSRRLRGNRYRSRVAGIRRRLWRNPRPIYEIARDIRRDWKSVNFGAVPYLDAMTSLDSIDDYFGADSGRLVVAYFLNNARGWRGPVATQIKAELKAMLKE